MSAATESTPVEVPVAQSQPEVISPPVNAQDTAPLPAEPAVQASQPDVGDDEPSPKKAKVEEATPPAPVKPGRRSRGSGVSIAEQTRKEAEALIKDLKDTPDGGRRTRSQTRGTPAPSPVQKASPRGARKPREATPAVKSTAPSSTEKRASSGGRRGRGRGRGRGRPPSRKPKAGADEADVPADEEDQGEDTADDVDGNNGTETTSSDAPAASVTENGVGGDGHEEAEPAVEESKAAVEESKAAVEESKPAGGVEERKGEEAPSDSWADEGAKPTPPSDPLAAEPAAASQPPAVASQPPAAESQPAPATVAE